jgi:hypothetical protein
MRKNYSIAARLFAKPVLGRLPGEKLARFFIHRFASLLGIGSRVVFRAGKNSVIP